MASTMLHLLQISTFISILSNLFFLFKKTIAINHMLLNFVALNIISILKCNNSHSHCKQKALDRIRRILNSDKRIYCMLLHNAHIKRNPENRYRPSADNKLPSLHRIKDFKGTYSGNGSIQLNWFRTRICVRYCTSRSEYYAKSRSHTLKYKTKEIVCVVGAMHVFAHVYANYVCIGTTIFRLRCSNILICVYLYAIAV